MDSDDIAMLDPEVVPDYSVQACAAIVKVVVGHRKQYGVLPLLAPNQDGVTTEELESLHGVI